MEQKKLSVIVPVYNVAEYLPECVESIQKQTYENLEIILIDDGSTDHSGLICDEYAKTDRRIRVIHQTNRGLMPTRQIGIMTATGTYLTFVDGDDWIDPDMYSDLIPYMRESDLVCSGYFIEDKWGDEIEVIDDFEEGLYAGKQLDMVLSRFLFDFEKDKLVPIQATVCDKLFRTELMKQIGFYKDFSISFGEDLVFHSQYILKCQSIYCCSKSYYHYRYRKNSICHIGNKEFLFDLAHVYLALEREFLKYDSRYGLMKQLRKIICVYAAKTWDLMFYDPEVRQMAFVLDISGLRGKKIILFGAGKCGQDFFRQMRAFDISVERWIDNQPGARRFGRMVESPDGISQWDFDLVLIAVLNPKTAEEIGQQLLDMNVPADKICWKKPLDITPY